GYTFPELVRPGMRLVHVYPDQTVIGTHFAADLAMACGAQAALAALGTPTAPAADARDHGWLMRLKAEQRAIAAPRSLTVDDGVPF
ncbi:hypothetical protein, partial [Acinetobacter baumannii]|uniref:hypothetical protein n=1 Tax=Acinetobacter baumannii TaxID=470 RepID=UPI001C0A4BAC